MSKLIALDAGHGLYTAGKRCLKSIDPKETREWVLNSRIANYVEFELKNYDCRTMRVDDISGATDPALMARVSRANNAKADLFVSIHHNAGINGGSGGGICVFTCVNPSSTSTALAKAVYDGTIARTGLTGNRAQAVLQTNFTVIYSTTMPAILGEFGFMDSTTDTPIILTDDFARKCASGIVDGIVKVAGLAKTGNASPSIPSVPLSALYRVRKSWSDADSQIGAWEMYESAKKAADVSPGYKVFDENGNVVYEPSKITEAKQEDKNVKTEAVYKTLDDIPDWGKPTIQKLLDKDLLVGDNTGLNIPYTMLRILVINDRAGLY